VTNPNPEHYAPKKKMLSVVIWHPFFEIWGQSQELSEIKPPLVAAGTKQIQYKLYSSIQPL
jgi:hypothetical protein